MTLCKLPPCVIALTARIQQWPGTPIILIILASLLVHQSAFSNEFYWDDQAHIIEGTLTRSLNNVTTIFTSEAWRNVEREQRLELAVIDSYRPMFVLSLLIDNLLAGHSRPWHHGVNVAIHLVNILLVYLLFTIWFPHKQSCLIAAGFALHPATVTCIHYVSARGDSMSTMFALMASWLALKQCTNHYKNILLAGFFFLCALLSKENVLVVMPWILIIGFTFYSDIKKKYFAFMIGVFVTVTVAYFALRLNALGAIKAVKDQSHIWTIFHNYPQVLFTLLRVTILEISPLPMRNFNVGESPYPLCQWVVIAAAYLLGGALVVAALFRKKKWVISLLWSVFLMAPPTVAIVKTGRIDGHYFYASAVGVASLSINILSSLKTRNLSHWIHPVATAVFLATISLLSWISAQHFRTEITFYKGIIQTSPAAPAAAYDLGNAYVRSENFDAAIKYYRMALEKTPGNAMIRNNLAIAYLRMGDYETAIKNATQVVSTNPNSAKYRYNLGLCFFKVKNWNRGLIQLKKSLLIDPGYASSQKLIDRFCRSKEGLQHLPQCDIIQAIYQIPK